ncbi:MAG TPA: acyl-CoA dehydrogenase [Burkholderiales bacterium]|nr:acyl-CoA dehydrogenase [Burkholderiales bacterium]
MALLIWILVLTAVLGALAYFRAPGWTWAAAGGAWLAGLTLRAGLAPAVSATLCTLLLVASALLLIGPLRRALLSDALLGWFRRVRPQVSQTEQEALDAGTVWFDGELFSGRPDWARWLSVPKPELSAEERAFIDGPVEQLCRMCDDWKISYELNDLPPELWQFIKDKGFLGMIIPKQYGGLGFSALAHSEVVMKLASRNPTACVSVMVPNSLGPAELLLHYGTEEQKNYYLPRLARGIDMPCFALTGPEAGSDAGAIPDFGVVCKARHEGKEMLGIRLNWEKRYITLGPVATVLGLAFKLYDPDHLIGEQQDIGITVALIPASHPGVSIGRRHAPLNGSFMNGPNWGKDVFIPMHWVVGGQAFVGQGWRMLMECLAAGRAISLPSSTTGGAKTAVRTTGAYSRVRNQFRVPIGKFEGVEEALARMGGNLYLMEAARVTTAGAVDLGEKPAVISAIVKYHCTERARQVINDAMDVHGGKGICLGPNNYLGRGYQQVPISITVEGANILTRSMIIFGQGAIRCHPYVLKEIAAAQEPDGAAASRTFDAALWGHFSYLIGNAARSLWLGATGALFSPAPGASETRAHFRHLTRFCAGFALAADVAMLLLGGELKRREKISARLGDILGHLYLASCTLKRWHDEGRQQTDLPFVQWAVQDAEHRIQEAFYGLFQNLRARPASWLLRLLIFPYGRTFSAPDDRLGHRVSRLLLEHSPARDRLTAGMFIHRHEADPVGRLELALERVAEAEQIETKVRAAVRHGAAPGLAADARTSAAVELGAITAAEAQALESYDGLRRACIMVDDFPLDVGRHTAAEPISLDDFQQALMARKTA